MENVNNNNRLIIYGVIQNFIDQSGLICLLIFFFYVLSHNINKKFQNEVKLYNFNSAIRNRTFLIFSRVESFKFKLLDICLYQLIVSILIQIKFSHNQNLFDTLSFILMIIVSFTLVLSYILVCIEIFNEKMLNDVNYTFYILMKYKSLLQNYQICEDIQWNGKS